MASLTVIKNWFKTGLKPTQQQFWDTWDSFYHKDSGVPVGDVQGINELFNGLVSDEQFSEHLTDPNAHEELFAKVKVFQIGEFALFKAPGNSGPGLEPKDIACGLLPDGNFVPFGQFIDGNPNIIASWDTSPITFTF